MTREEFLEEALKLKGWQRHKFEALGYIRLSFCDIINVFVSAENVDYAGAALSFDEALKLAKSEDARTRRRLKALTELRELAGQEPSTFSHYMKVLKTREGFRPLIQLCDYAIRDSVKQYEQVFGSLSDGKKPCWGEGISHFYSCRSDQQPAPCTWEPAK